jgi:hypothetical protein
MSPARGLARPSSSRAVAFALSSLVAIAGAGCADSTPFDLMTGAAGSSPGAGGNMNSRGGAGGSTGTGGSTARGGAGGSAGSAQAGTGGTTTGAAGRGGSGGAAGAGGRGGTGGSAGASGRGGTGGSAGAGGTTARGGAGGAAGSSGSGGRGGASGGSGTGGSSARGGSGGSAGASGGSGGSSRGGAGGSAGASGAGGSGGSSRGGAGGSGGSAGSAAGAGGSSGTGGSAGSPWTAGNPNGSCSAGVPTKAQAVSTSNPTTVVGTGTAASCTLSALQAAITAGGIVTFNCGPDAVTIPVTATLTVPSNKNTVVDGGRKITLDGGGAVQIMRFHSANFQANDYGLTLQHIALINGKTTPTEMIPTRPAPCSQGYNDGEGGALYMRDGYLVVVDSIFTNNKAATVGPDTGGGAIYVLGSKGGVWISGSTFTNNQGSNAGAVGGLFAELNIYNSLFRDNRATGHDANSNDPSMCSYMNNDQNQIGSGGNGGAIYSDGNDVDLNLCGDAILNNAAGTNAFGGGVFFTSNNFGGTLAFADTTMTGNTGRYWTQAQMGSITNAGTAVGTNCRNVTISNSTIQGVP